MIEQRKSNRVTKQIIKVILTELDYNWDLAKRLDTKYVAKYAEPQPISSFDLFQESSWKLFSSRLELDDVEVLYRLGTVYHRFERFNEAMKLESLGGECSTILREDSNFLKKLAEDIEGVIEELTDYSFS
jgi:hypothetical protein